jgi:hypothetical protein
MFSKDSIWFRLHSYMWNNFFYRFSFNCLGILDICCY